MLLQEAIFAYLTNAAQDTAAIVQERVYPNLVPQEAPLPCVAYQVIGAPQRWLAHDGPTDLARVMVQFTAMAGRYIGSQNLARALRNDLDGFAGVMGGVGGVEIERAHVENQIDDFENVDVDVVRIDVSFIHKEQ